MQLFVYKTNTFIKLGLCILLSILTVIGQSQEICDNGIDDDNDALIDLNDNECDCPTTVPLTAVTGFICKNNLKLQIDYAAGINFQWFQDGVALDGETQNFIELRESATVEGDYVCLITTSGDCVQTVPFEVIIPDPVEVDLGIEYICPGDCVTFGPFTLCQPGRWQNDDTAVNGCDSTTYMELIIYPPTRFEYTDTICNGQTYMLNDLELSNQGIYMDTIQNHRGCDSIITLDLRVLDIIRDTVFYTICPGDSIEVLGNSYFDAGTYLGSDTTSTGCLIDVTINVGLLENTFDTLERSICLGDTFRLLNIVASEAGIYKDTLTNVAGCDSIISVNLEILQPTTYQFSDTICTGNVFQYFNIVATEPGVYYDTITNSVGCDSIISVVLSVFDEVEFTLEETICQGDSVVLNGIVFKNPGQYYEVIESPTGCDSLVTLNLNVNRPSGTTLYETICIGDFYQLYDIDTNQAGRYKTTITNAVGCDSVITVELTVQDPQIYEFADTICFGATYSLHDIEESEIGQYSTIVQTPEGCDSTIIVNLHVLDIITNTIYDTICFGGTYTNADIVASNPGIYSTILQTSDGCDSSLTVELFVNDIITTSIFDTICAGATYINGDITTEVAGNFNTTFSTLDGCDSLLNVSLHVLDPITNTIQREICSGSTFILNDIQASTAGIYTTQLTTPEGCDSILTIEITLADSLFSNTEVSVCEGDTTEFNEYLATESGTYYSQLMTQDGCDSTAILDLTVNPLLRQVYNVKICDGELFEMNDIQALSTGIYTTRKSNPGRCDSLITVNLTVNSLSDHIELGDDMDLTLGDELDVVPEYLYEHLMNLEWHDKDDNFLGEEEILYDFAPTSDTWVFLEGIDEIGCPSMDSLMIRVNLDIKVAVPNVISNNNDGNNDNLVIKVNNAIESIESYVIYDRWGNKVHEGIYAEDVDNLILWDGTYKGQPVEAGVYAYFLRFNIIDGSVYDVHGDITIIR
jgi:gliding motility-associated-like protein